MEPKKHAQRKHVPQKNRIQENNNCFGRNYIFKIVVLVISLFKIVQLSV